MDLVSTGFRGFNGQVKGNEEKKDGTGANGDNGEKEELAELREFFGRMGEILDRDGRPEEKLLEARAVWGEAAERIEG